MQIFEFKEYKAKWENKQLEVKFFKNNEYLFSKNKNSYRTQDDEFMLFEYFELEGKIVFIFHEEHGCLSVFNADTGDLIHQSEK